MTTAPPPTVVDEQADLSGRRLGRLATLALGLVLGGWALTVDFPKVTNGGFFSDGATYYSLAHSLAADGDFAFAREDLQRVWREFATGPEGIFLKRGRDVLRERESLIERARFLDAIDERLRHRLASLVMFRVVRQHTRLERGGRIVVKIGAHGAVGGD